jgi:2-aminoadipate transaminase
MLAAIARSLPAGVQVDPPQGGLFLWLQLPGGLSADELLPLACEEGVDFVPGSSFYPDGGDGKDRLRLNFVVQPPDEIEEGLRRLGKAVAKMRAAL